MRSVERNKTFSVMVSPTRPFLDSKNLNKMKNERAWPMWAVKRAE